MDSFNFLLVIAIILLSTKALGLLSEKVHMPQVVGALLAGVILGPSVLNVVGESDFIVKTAEIGVIMLMFIAGLDTDLEELKKNGIASLIIALIGVILPLVGGFLSYTAFFGINSADSVSVLRAIFVGVVLTATSVSITVETLREMGRLKGRMGTTILGAAIIDDIVGIIVLTVITSFKDSDIKPFSVIAKILIYFVFIAVVAFVVHLFSKIIDENDHKRRTSIYSLSFCFIMSFLSERIFGIADITGAYFAGIILCNLGIKDYVTRRVAIPSYLIFSPIFFASIGLKTKISTDAGLIGFTVVLLIVAILTKIAGCGLGAKFCKFPTKEAVCIGIGMISRGEVALIVAQKGEQVGLLSEALFPPIVLVVIVTTLITPILLKIALANTPTDNSKDDDDGNDLVKSLNSSQI